MSSQPSLVPSRAALRVLHHLAFAGSAITALGVVSLNCHVYSQLMQREQSRERRRQLRALSSGTGQSSLARLIEAAETGQDISMRAMRNEPKARRDFVSNNPADPALSASELQHQRGGTPRKSQNGCTARPRIPAASKGGNLLHRACDAPRHFATTSTTGPRNSSREDREGERKTEEDNSLETVAQPSTRRLQSTREQAAERIKQTALAMTSCPPRHVYARPKRKTLSNAALRARPQLHAPVGSWLGTERDGASRLEDQSLATSLSSSDHPAQASSQQPGANIPTDTNILGSGVDETDGDIAPPGGGNLSRPRPLIATTIRSEKASSAEHHPHRPITDPGQSLSGPGSDLWRQPEETADAGFPGQDTRGSHQSIESQRCTAERPSQSGLVQADPRPGDTAPTEDLTPMEDGQAKAVKASESVAVPAKHVEAAPATVARNFDDSQMPPQPDSHLQKVGQKSQSGFTPWPHLPLSDESDLFEGTDDMVQLLKEELAEEPTLKESQDGDILSGSENKDKVGGALAWTPFIDPAQPSELGTDQQDQDGSLPSEPLSPAPDPHEGLQRAETLLDNLLADLSAKKVMTAEERAKVAFRISRVFDCSRGGGVWAWKAAILQRQGLQDFAALDFLYREFIEKGNWLISPRHHLVQELVQWHFGRNRHCPRAAEILFPSPAFYPEASSETSEVRPEDCDDAERVHRGSSQSAIRFLQGLWEARVDSDWLMLNFRRVIGAAKLRGAKLVEDLFAVTIRYLSSVGDMTTAQAVYDEMVFYHGISASFLSRSLLLRGYARISDWARVEHEIQSLHHEGLSRCRPHGFALLVNAVLKEYSARRSVEQVQSFIINAISFWGLIPTSSVSSTLVQTYLSAQRYDLIREWMETLQVLFPKIETETGLFRWTLGNMWQRTKASCEDIERSLRALTYRNAHSRVRVYSRPTIYEALSRDLAGRLGAAGVDVEASSQSPPSSKVEVSAFIPAKPLAVYLSSAFSLLASATSEGSHPSDAVVDLHRQALAVERLISFLDGKPSSPGVDKFVFSTVSSHRAGNGDLEGPLARNLAELQNRIPDLLLWPFLPECTTITAAVIEFYKDRHMRRQRCDHVVFRWVCEKLYDADRAFDAMLLIQNVYRDGLVRQLSEPEAAPSGSSSDDGHGPGVGVNDLKVAFPMEFFEFWMRLAWATKSRTQWRHVVEEVLRLSGPGPGPGAGETLTISASFAFLTRLCAIKLLKVRHGGLRLSALRHFRPAAEMMWYVNRVTDRRAEQVGWEERWHNMEDE